MMKKVDKKIFILTIIIVIVIISIIVINKKSFANKENYDYKLINNNINITNSCMIGSGAVVVGDIKEPGTYVGVPARRLS